MIFLWLIFWSLGSVVMTRFSDWITKAKLRGFFFGRSECPQCKHTLKTKNLVPVVSYFVQWGRCEYCKKQISRTYPVLEILCAGIFVATYFLLKDFWIERLVFWLLMNRFLILLLVYDLQKYELHMIARILLMTLWILANINVSWGNDWNFLMSTIIFWVTFSLIYLFAKRYVKMRFKLFFVASSKILVRNSLLNRSSVGVPTPKICMTPSIIIWLWKSLKSVFRSMIFPTVVFPTAGGPNNMRSFMHSIIVVCHSGV